MQGTRASVTRHGSRVTSDKRRIMQNKPNLPVPQMDVSLVITREYKNKSDWKLGENKANQSQFAGCSNERKFCFNKGL